MWGGELKWSKPHQGWFSCNVDAATSVEKSLSSFGCIIRNDAGEFVAGLGGVFLGVVDPKLAEAMAFREALSWVNRKALENVVFQLDALGVVQAWSRKKRDISYFGDTIDDCLCICKDLRSYSVKFVRRSANIAAHSIARKAISLSERKEWVSVSSYLSNVILQDIA